MSSPQSQSPSANDRRENHVKHIADLRAVLDVSRELAATAELIPLLKTVEKAALAVLE